jgi:squalene cyclase
MSRSSLLDQCEQQRPDQAAVARALAAAVEHLWRTQRPDGSWESLCDVGPVSTAQMLVTLHYLGRLDPQDAHDAARWLVAQQRADGSFPGYPFAERGDLGVTATAWAALHVAGRRCEDPALRRARGYIDAHGGLDEVVRGLSRGDLAALNLAMAGLLDPQRLPRFPLTHCLIEPLRQLLQRRFNGAVLTIFLETAILIRRLRGEWGPDGLNKSSLDEQACRSCLQLLDEFQNADGSWWNGVTPWSGLILATVHAMALPESADRIERGLRPINALQVHDKQGLQWMAFGSGTWGTGFNVRALLAAGVGADDPRMRAAVDWLLSCQIERPQSPMNNRRPGAPRTGGWSFQKPNEALPDTDDTGVVLSALGLAAQRSSDSAWAEKVSSSARRGLDWLAGMKNPDGGWATYVQGLPGKPAGPIMSSTVDADLIDPAAVASMLFEPPVDLGDPSFEDVAGRILHGVGTLGLTLDHPDIQSAMEFLRAQQCPDGCWWGRWINFVVSTSWVLIGLRAVGVEADEDWMQRAAHWLLGRQNADGGWGETHHSYRNPELGGVAPSMPAVTGIVLVTLCELGLRDHPAVVRGAQYLLDQQRPDGTWDNNGFLHTLIPPDTFYYLPPASHYWPLEGLARVLHDDLPPPRIDLPESQRDEFKDALRQQGDPVADAVAAALFEGGVEVNALLGGLLRSGPPWPRHLPPALADYFTQTATLPEWVDPAKILMAQRLFARYGWEVALSLFCSALPQGYCSGPCARCMGRTRSLTQAARRRVFETAQFLFDVLDESGLTPAGRGVRACQLIRLKHAVLRHLLAKGQELERDGLPVNQEDLHGTLLLFTVAPLDVLRKLEMPVSADEAAAWVHTWAVIGHLLGVDDRLLPRSVAEAEVQLLAFRRRHWEATPQGRELARALVELMQSYYPAPLAQLPVVLIRYLSGPRCAELLGLPPVDWSRLAVETGVWLSQKWMAGDLAKQFNGFAGQLVQRVMQGLFLLQAQGQLNWTQLLLEATQAAGLLAPAAAGGVGAAPVRHLAYWLMKGLVLTEREGQPAPFRLPASLSPTP